MPCFAYLFVCDGHLGCFLLWASVNNAAVSVNAEGEACLSEKLLAASNRECDVIGLTLKENASLPVTERHTYGSSKEPFSALFFPSGWLSSWFRAAELQPRHH